MHPQFGDNQWQLPVGYPVQQPAQPPPSIKNAVTVMYVGGALESLVFILDLIGRDAPSRSVRALIGAGLWFWMASANNAGKNWARITLTVIFGLDCIGLIGTVAGASRLTTGHAAVLIGSTAVLWVLMLTAIILLYTRASIAYFRAMRGIGGPQQFSGPPQQPGGPQPGGPPQQ